MTDVRVFCPGLDQRGYGGYNAHPRGDARFIRVVPFLVALHEPPECLTHKRPYRMVGGYRFDRMIQEWAERGVRYDCGISYGPEGAVWCHPHYWSRSEWDNWRHVDADGHCPMWPVAQWMKRLHEQVIPTSVGSNE